MIDIDVSDDNAAKWVRVQGRLDSLTAPDLEKCLGTLIRDGQRIIVLDLPSVHYMSSLGLRVLLAAQKQLQRADGEILICRPAAAILDLFEMSGFKHLFRIFPDPESLRSEVGGPSSDIRPACLEVDGIALECIQKTAAPGRFSIIGRQEKLSASLYGAPDVVTVKAADIQYGAGLASLGDVFDEYRHYFGEAVVLNHSLFFYPAVRRPAVDFLLCTDAGQNVSYPFLHGFSFSGSFSRLISFESVDQPVTLDALSRALGQMVPANLFAMVLLAESRGVWGMHLKRVPILENRPANGRDIFDPANFPGWMNFPVEASDFHRILAGAALVVKNPDQAPAPVLDVLARGSRVHCHAGIFSAEPLSKKPDQLENELDRVITELPAAKVQHLMGQSRFQQGLAGIIELESI